MLISSQEADNTQIQILAAPVKACQHGIKISINSFNCHQLKCLNSRGAVARVQLQHRPARQQGGGPRRHRAGRRVRVRQPPEVWTGVPQEAARQEDAQQAFGTGEWVPLY